MTATSQPTIPELKATTSSVSNPVTEPAASAPAPSPEPPAPSPEPAAAAPRQDDWAQRRIDELTAEKYALRAERDHLAQTNANLSAGQKPAATPPAPSPQPATEPAQPSLTDEQINARAAQMVAAQRFNDNCNRVFDEGKTGFTDFETNVATLARVGDREQFTSLLQLAVELPTAAKILNHLGKNPDEASKLFKMPSTKMAMELARLENTINAAVPPVSNTPAPIKPVSPTANGATNLDDPALPMSEWVKLRDQQKAARKRGYV